MGMEPWEAIIWAVVFAGFASFLFYMATDDKISTASFVTSIILMLGVGAWQYDANLCLFGGVFMIFWLSYELSMWMFDPRDGW